MKVLRIKIGGRYFLLPEPSVENDYEFPTYIMDNKKYIIQLIGKMKVWTQDPLGVLPQVSPEFDLDGFKKKTGIIGFPFDARDPDLYLLDNPKIEVVLDIDLDL